MVAAKRNNENGDDGKPKLTEQEKAKLTAAAIIEESLTLINLAMGVSRCPCRVCQLDARRLQLISVIDGACAQALMGDTAIWDTILESFKKVQAAIGDQLAESCKNKKEKK